MSLTNKGDKATLTPKGGDCVKGSVVYMKDRGYYAVSWYDPEIKGSRKITRNHKGDRMWTQDQAETLLTLMRADVERGTFRIDKYTREAPIDTVAWLRTWFTAIQPTLKPATIKDYGNSIENHLIPFFTLHPCPIQEIELDVLTMLLNWIPREGKGKMNVMYCLHAALDFAWRARKISSMPPFPRKKQYQMEEPEIVWLPEERQLKIINRIPALYRPIFMWCKLHYRRPGEAVALHKEDFDGNTFFIHRTMSARHLTNTTKTGETHYIPCHDDFRRYLPIVEAAHKQAGVISQFFFVNPLGRLKGKPFTDTVMQKLWHTACKGVGENIRMYAGLKYSSCSQFINEKGGTLSELQEITDHARYESVRKYAKTEVARRKDLMGRGVIAFTTSKMESESS